MNHFRISTIKYIIDNIHKPILFIILWLISIFFYVIILLFVRYELINFNYVYLGIPLAAIGTYFGIKIAKYDD